MEILGIGVPELVFIVLIALILLGPKDMVAAGRMIASTYRKILLSPVWQVMRLTRDEFQQASTKLVRAAGLEDLKAMQKEVQDVTRDVAHQIRPSDFSKAFDERQVLSQSIPTPVSTSTPQPASSSNQPDSPSAPPPAPEA
jgi:Sec-independent protein translocase protein TatA